MRLRTGRICWYSSLFLVQEKWCCLSELQSCRRQAQRKPKMWLLRRSTLTTARCKFSFLWISPPRGQGESFYPVWARFRGPSDAAPQSSTHQISQTGWIIGGFVAHFGILGLWLWWPLTCSCILANLVFISPTKLSQNRIVQFELLRKITCDAHDKAEKAPSPKSIFRAVRIYIIYRTCSPIPAPFFVDWTALVYLYIFSQRMLSPWFLGSCQATSAVLWDIYGMALVALILLRPGSMASSA